MTVIRTTHTASKLTGKAGKMAARTNCARAVFTGNNRKILLLGRSNQIGRKQYTAAKAQRKNARGVHAVEGDTRQA